MKSSSTFDSSALQGLVAVVTGASSGIGQPIVQRLLAMGAQVVQVDVSYEQESVLIEGSWHLKCDFGDTSSVSAMAEQVRKQLQRCDVLVNNAAISAAPVVLEHLPSALRDRTLEINLRGASGIASESLVVESTPEQKSGWLPQLASGHLTGCFALTEPQAGSDATTQKTTTRALRRFTSLILPSAPWRL